ncbi:MAG: hypothetical protein WA913_02785, partial [Pricia sp.]
MRKQVKSIMKYGMAGLALCLFMASCSNDDSSVFETPEQPMNPDGENPDNPEEPQVATLIFSEAAPAENQTEAEASGEVGTAVPGRVIFTSTETTQRRMYITQQIQGGAEIPFNAFDLEDTDLQKELKGDGSIDLDGSNKMDIDFTFELPVPDIEDGEIVYKFWTTTGKGDFRDATKRFALGIGTITVTVGNGTNPAAEVRSYSDIKLFAPAEDGNSETFFSLLDGTVYNIIDGPEFRAFWDFGYYWTNSTGASFSSTANYKTVFNFEVAGFEPGEDEADTENETLNQMFFAESTLTADEFDGIILSGDLANISASTNQQIEGLAVGDVIEFVGNYGKKGLIKIT